MIIESTRLYLREFIQDDAVLVFHLNNDPEVMKYTGDKPFESVEAAREFLINYDHYNKHGYGRWAVFEKKSGEFVGWCGLKYHSEDITDVGYRLLKAKWGKGFATEAADTCLKIGFTQFNCKRIIGRAMKQNIASIRVLEKIGLKYWKEDKCGGENGVIYKIDNVST
jgi:[ribosomal protein S5]-alanine N-acetyltransferase